MKHPSCLTYRSNVQLCLLDSALSMIYISDEKRKAPRVCIFRPLAEGDAASGSETKVNFFVIAPALYHTTAP